jgi:hypothetical protein
MYGLFHLRRYLRTETIVNIDRIVADLRAERDRLDQAISALEGQAGRGGRRAAGMGPRRRRHMSPDARRRISEMMKKRWAERKRKTKAA